MSALSYHDFAHKVCQWLFGELLNDGSMKVVIAYFYISKSSLISRWQILRRRKALHSKYLGLKSLKMALMTIEEKIWKCWCQLTWNKFWPNYILFVFSRHHNDEHNFPCHAHCQLAMFRSLVIHSIVPPITIINCILLTFATSSTQKFLIEL